jgi:hypothetical protein
MPVLFYFSCSLKRELVQTYFSYIYHFLKQLSSIKIHTLVVQRWNFLLLTSVK